MAFPSRKNFTSSTYSAPKNEVSHITLFKALAIGAVFGTGLIVGDNVIGATKEAASSPVISMQSAPARN